MTPLCRYILPAGRHCEQPAVRGTHFCRHHGELKRVTRRPPRKRYDFAYIIPFVYAEDRAGIQFNLHLVTQALSEGKIDVRTANAYTNNIRAAATNLRQGPLVETGPQQHRPPRHPHARRRRNRAAPRGSRKRRVTHPLQRLPLPGMRRTIPRSRPRATPRRLQMRPLRGDKRAAFSAQRSE